MIDFSWPHDREEAARVAELYENPAAASEDEDNEGEVEEDHQLDEMIEAIDTIDGLFGKNFKYYGLMYYTFTYVRYL